MRTYCRELYSVPCGDLNGKFSSVQSLSRVRLRPRGLQHARPPCPSPTPRVYSNSCPWSRWCRPTILSSVVPLSLCLRSFPASGSFPVSQLSPSGGQSIGASASTSVLPVNILDWFPLDCFDLLAVRREGGWGFQYSWFTLLNGK